MSAVAPSAAARHGCLGMGMGRARELGGQSTTGASTDAVRAIGREICGYMEPKLSWSTVAGRAGLAGRSGRSFTGGDRDA